MMSALRCLVLPSPLLEASKCFPPRIVSSLMLFCQSGCLVLRADAICFKFDRDHLAPWANGIESALSGN
jgi:hypothetical protein